jgi:UPF0271 protein
MLFSKVGTMKRIDLNSDLGEAFGPWPMGDDKAMLAVVSSANIACGGHASDPETMFNTLMLARDNGVIVGAHPGYNDREGFGRRVIPMTPEQAGKMVAAQIGALVAMAALADVEVRYVKLHGALANLAARDEQVSEAIANVIEKVAPKLAILAISGTQLEIVARAKGMKVFSEIFADRGYLSTGQLVPRGQEGAMIHDAEEAADRLVQFMETGLMPVIDGPPIALHADSICVHGDSPTAVAMAEKVSDRLKANGIDIMPFLDK